MRFKDPLFFLLLIPAVVLIFLYVRHKIGAEASIRFPNVGLVRQAGGRRAGMGRFFRGFLRLAAFLFLITALARPQTGTGEEKTTEHVVDIMIALDISGSMATLDFQPENRLTAAKLEARRFIEGRPHDRMGLVIFAGQSLTQCPLTTDRQALLTLLDKIQLGMLEDGTAIGLGLASSLNRLKNSDAKRKVIILLTDGVNNAGEIHPLTATNIAKDLGIRVYAIGVGKEGMSVLPVQDPQLGTRLLRVETTIDEKMMKEIAAKTSGLYFRAQDTRGLKDIFKEIDKLEKTEITVESYMRYEERYFWFVWLALFLLLFEIVWKDLIFVKLP
jgi:Ca-activated chloride channel family protein